MPKWHRVVSTCHNSVPKWHNVGRNELEMANFSLSKSESDMVDTSGSRCYTEGMARAVGYVRVSCSKQAQSGLGLEAQRQAIQRWAESRGIDVDIRVDAGQTGRKMNRSGLKMALDRLATDPADPPGGGSKAQGPHLTPILVVSKLDRLSRSVVHLGQILQQLEAAGAHLVVISEGIDTTTASGRLAANILISVAQWESEAISERTRAAREVVRQRGGSLGGRAAIDASHVARARELRQGRSLRQVGAALASEGMVSHSGRQYAAQQLRRMLGEC